MELFERASRCRELLSGAQEDLVEERLRLVLGLLEGVHHLRGQDLLGPRVHLLLARREALVLLAHGEITDDLGEFIDVAGLDVVPVVLETPVPVLRHLRDIVGKNGQDLLDGILVDHAPQAGLAGVLARDHDGHVVVEDLDRQVLAYLAKNVLLFLLDHLAGPMMGVDHVVADLEIDVDDYALDLEIFDLQGCLGNRVLLRHGPGTGPCSVVQVCRYRSTRLISCRRRRPSRMSFARISPTPSTDSSSGSVAARISSSPRNSRTMFCTTSRGRRGMRPRMRKPRGETG